MNVLIYSPSCLGTSRLYSNDLDSSNLACTGRYDQLYVLGQGGSDRSRLGMWVVCREAISRTAAICRFGELHTYLGCDFVVYN